MLRIDVIDGDGQASAPNAVAGAAQTVASGSRVTLDGSGSNDPNGDSLTYAWLQVLGPAVALSGADTASPSFTAPSVGSDTMLRFELQVSDPTGLSDNSLVTVTVTAAPATPGGNSSGGGGGGSPFALLVLALGIFARRVIRTGRS